MLPEYSKSPILLDRTLEVFYKKAGFGGEVTTRDSTLRAYRNLFNHNALPVVPSSRQIRKLPARLLLLISSVVTAVDV
jgi:hypothetical protein